jgi:DNA topoisomerase-1
MITREKIIGSIKQDFLLKKGKSDETVLYGTKTVIEGGGAKNIHQKIQEDFLLKKGKSKPIGTVTGNYKKVSEGKWVPVKKDKPKKEEGKDSKALHPKIVELNKKHQLSRLPIGVSIGNIQINDGNSEGNWILKWKDPKTNKTVLAYSKSFLEKNAQQKWKRIEQISKKDIDIIEKSCLDELSSKNAQQAAVIAIIAKTGLRPGSRDGFKETENRGVCTLSKDNVKIEGDSIMFEFRGKSYKNNTAEIKSKELASYLGDLIKDKKGEDFIFDTKTQEVRDFLNKISPDKKIKLKDFRTYVATDMAKNILFNDKSSPPPLPEKGVKKLIQSKLKNVFEKVSSQLNNTPTMAKTSYVHPKVIDKWLDSLGVSFENNVLIRKAINSDYEDTDNEDYEDIDEYALPDWWDDTL